MRGDTVTVDRDLLRMALFFVAMDYEDTYLPAYCSGAVTNEEMRWWADQDEMRATCRGLRVALGLSESPYELSKGSDET